VPILDSCIPTEVILEADRSFKLNSRDEKEYSYRIEGAGLISKQTPMPTFYRGDKRDPREKLASGIYSNGAASNLARIRIDNPFPEDTDVLVQITATVPLLLRKGQHCRIQVNTDGPHEAFIRGKYLIASIPCSGRPRHISLLMQFWNMDGSETESKENRAVIKSITVLPSGEKKANIQSGWRSILSYLRNRIDWK